ncbi:unnamed protein product [Alopecurus aequalis]
MAESYSGEYGYPYPRVDQYGNPVGPVDQYGIPIPREPAEQQAYSSGPTALSYGTSDVAPVVPADYGLGGAMQTHEGVVGGVVSPDGAAQTHAQMHESALSGGLAPGETTAYAYEGMVGSGISSGDQIQPIREEHTTLGETLRRSGSSSSSSSSSEDDGQGGRRRKKKSIKEKIKEKLPGSHKHEEHKAEQTAGTGTHEKKGIMEKIKEKLPGHH